jgi:hypothetical protein
MDGLLRHLGETVSEDSRKRKAQHKTVYAMARDGMKVAHIGTTGRRFRFNTDWADEYLEQKAATPRTFKQTPRKQKALSVVQGTA